jgi:succinyl-diaminopimelate desuccinylase
MLTTLALVQRLVALESVSPADAGCQNIIAEQLLAMDFKAENFRFNSVNNVWLRRGLGPPVFAFAGHTDVVPAGPLEQWQSPPFVPTLRNGYLYGRGAADMKASLAAMVIACQRFVHGHPEHPGSIALLLTSDEEGPAVDGTARVVEILEQRNEKITWCLVGEPTSDQLLGDVIKHGRRGSFHGQLRLYGLQGHVAYPHLADNPIHRFGSALAELAAEQWDQGNDYFPPTTFQISNIHAGTGATNMIPGHLDVMFNFRYSTEVTCQNLKQRVAALLDRHKLRYDLEWTHSGKPFITPKGELLSACQSAIIDIAGITPRLSTSGGTSDGRFIAPTGAQVVELGPVNTTIHQANECVKIDDIEMLSDIYLNILERLLITGSD